jgi:hypothetical protein
MRAEETHVNSHTVSLSIITFMVTIGINLRKVIRSRSLSSETKDAIIKDPKVLSQNAEHRQNFKIKELASLL